MSTADTLQWNESYETLLPKDKRGYLLDTFLSCKEVLIENYKVSVCFPQTCLSNVRVAMCPEFWILALCQQLLPIVVLLPDYSYCPWMVYFSSTIFLVPRWNPNQRDIPEEIL